MDPFALLVLLVVFIVLMTKMTLDYRTAEAEREASAMRLTTSEFRQLIQDSINEATLPLQRQLDENGNQLALLREQSDRTPAHLLEARTEHEEGVREKELYKDTRDGNNRLLRERG